MLFFDIAEISEEKGLDFTVHRKRTEFDIQQEDCFLSQDVEIQGHLDRMGQEIYFAGSIRTQITVKCSRCLEPVRIPVLTQVRAHYLPRSRAPKGALEVEIHASDIETEFYEEQRIRLDQPIHDQILLTVPQVPLCRKDCRGLCPECGHNLNKGDCGCTRDKPLDPRLEVLKQLKDKLK